MSIFTEVQGRRPRTNTFNLSHDIKLTTDIGRLTPFYLQECVPGDSFRIRSSSLARFAPMTFPVMHKVDLHMHYFFVPNRILWKNWENFITNTEDIVPPIFQLYSEGIAAEPGSIMDYMGIVPGATYVHDPLITDEVDNRLSLLPLAAYAKIWYEYYKDENHFTGQFDDLAEPFLDNGQIPVITGTWLDYLRKGRTSTEIPFRAKAWRKDYYTSALPWPQKGSEVLLPLDLTSEFRLKPSAQWSATTPGLNLDSKVPYSGAASPIFDAGNLETTSSGLNIGLDVSGYHEVHNTGLDLTINDLRRSIALQEWLEKNARGGTRYIEHIKSHFGVNSSDKRLQRPEFLGGLKKPIVISEVLQTSETTETGTPLGEMGGHAISANSGKNIRYFCEEHGWIIGIMFLMPQNAYMQETNRLWFRKDPLEYYWPSFAHLGEQEILRRELYPVYGVHTEPKQLESVETFGYTPRYAEYKFTPSRVAGDFRDSLKDWHMAREFNDFPHLDPNFIYGEPTKRIFAIADGPEDLIWMHVFNDIKARRPMPVFGTPKIQ